MRLAVIADSHFDEHSRFDECKRIHAWIAADAQARGCTAWLHAGDVFERRSTPAERLAVADWVEQMRSLVGPGIIVRGNHDALGDLPLLERLHGTPVTVVEDARCVDLFGDRVACMAWPQRASIAALAQASRDGVEATAQEALRNVLRGLGAQRPDLFLGHCMVRGSVTSTGQPLVGHDLEVGLEDLALVGADAYLLGHVHAGQAWDIAGAPCVYPGSPRRANFGELECKAYLIVEVDGQRVGSEWVATVERIETPATRMLHLEAHWHTEHVALPGDVVVPAELVGYWSESTDSDCNGAEVRLRYTTPADQRDAARASALALRDRMITLGAVYVKLEEVVVSETRARAPEVATATTLADKLDRLWEAKSFDPGPRRESLLGKAHDLEQESAA